MIEITLGIWLVLGSFGYFMMRRGLLFEFEQKLGKKEAWNKQNMIIGLISILLGPLFMVIAWNLWRD